MVVASLLFTRISGAHYLVCLDQQEPTTDVIEKAYIVGALLGGDACPGIDSPADISLDLSLDNSAAKSVQVDVEVAALVYAFIVLFQFRLLAPAPESRRVPAPYLSPPRFIRPLLRAPPL